MIRTITIAATAAILLAAPARAESIRISTVGKSAEQVKLEVQKAARQLCFAETRGMVGYLTEYRNCVEESVKTALLQST
jgi:hypothetical protein